MMVHYHNKNYVIPETDFSDSPHWKLATYAIVAAVAAAGAASYSSSEQHQESKKAANAQRDALEEQKRAQENLKAEAAAAPENERLAELDKRRRRVSTLLSDQKSSGTVPGSIGTKNLLGG